MQAQEVIGSNRLVTTILPLTDQWVTLHFRFRVVFLFVDNTDNCSALVLFRIWTTCPLPVAISTSYIACLLRTVAGGNGCLGRIFLGLLMPALLFFRQLAAFVERHGWNWPQGPTETIARVAPFTLANQRAFGNQIHQVPCGRRR